MLPSPERVEHCTRGERDGRALEVGEGWGECGALQEGGELEVGRVEHWLRG